MFSSKFHKNVWACVQRLTTHIHKAPFNSNHDWWSTIKCLCTFTRWTYCHAADISLSVITYGYQHMTQQFVVTGCTPCTATRTHQLYTLQAGDPNESNGIVRQCTPRTLQVQHPNLLLKIFPPRDVARNESGELPRDGYHITMRIEKTNFWIDSRPGIAHFFPSAYI